MKTPDQVFQEMRKLQPYLETAAIDPMLCMYMLKLADSFPKEIDAAANNEDLHKTATRLGKWLIQRIESVNDLNIKANYEKALACVEWFCAECGCHVALRSLGSDDPIQAVKIALALSEDYARQYENRMGEEAFIYSELQEKLVHARTFIEEVNQMNRTLDAIIKANDAAQTLTGVISNLNAAAEALTKAAGALTDALNKLAGATPNTAATPPVTDPLGIKT